MRRTYKDQVHNEARFDRGKYLGRLVRECTDWSYLRWCASSWHDNPNLLEAIVAHLVKNGYPPPVVRVTMHAVDRLSTRGLDRYTDYLDRYFDGETRMGIVSYVRMVAERLVKQKEPFFSDDRADVYFYVGLGWVLLRTPGVPVLLTVLSKEMARNLQVWYKEGGKSLEEAGRLFHEIDLQKGTSQGEDEQGVQREPEEVDGPRFEGSDQG